ncbi:MAG: two component transcriptional regulator, LuxR family [Chthonomonadaceae bacterium]|nr:two component transcriptional regulator, LuxR family [Chthonomonadaceae bacterium]
MSLSLRIRVLIVDDHPVVRLGLFAAIRQQPDMAVVATAADLMQALPLCRTNLPDVIILDLRLPGTPSDQAVQQIQSAHPSGHILLLSADDAGEELYRALEAGAAGCIERTTEMEELVDAIRIIHAGRVWLFSEALEQWKTYQEGVRLSETEQTCLRLLAAGKTSVQIALALGRTERQVRCRLHRIQTKLGAKSETHMLVTALRRGIVSLE